MATAAARTGLSVLLVEVAGRSASAPMFGADPQGYEEATVLHEAGDDEVGSVTLKSITPIRHSLSGSPPTGSTD